MKSTHGKALKAYLTLQAMGSKQIPSSTAYKLFKLKKALLDVVEFQTEEEKKLVDECGGTITENGTIIIEDAEKRKEYAAKYKELEQMECDVEYNQIKLSSAEIKEMSINEMEALEDFVNFG